jgi:hypothetical protein
MITNTYRLAVALQAKAIDSIDLHAEGSFVVTHTFGADITVVARYRTGAGQRILQMLARDADAHLLGSAEAAVPAGGGLRVRVPRYRCGSSQCPREVFAHNTSRLARPGWSTTRRCARYILRG